jgi:GNAT superfamily N-acetyltransferase
MHRIESILPNSPLVPAARALFTAYRDFLETIESTHCFDFKRFQEEIATLPAAYTEANGELLLAFVDDEPAGCIAFRAAPSESPATCEIKRLFTLPTFRKQGIARALIGEAHPSASSNAQSLSRLKFTYNSSPGLA